MDNFKAVYRILTQLEQTWINQSATRKKSTVSSWACQRNVLQGILR